ncbi:MAG: DUF4443 domain-containing protein [Candidatus Bathyarchaeota archaeon]
MNEHEFFRILKKVLKSKGGPPLTFTLFHVIEALEIIGNENNIGRVKLAKKLGLGEGATRTLLKHLKENKLITVHPAFGCRLTEAGKKLYKIINSNLSRVVELPKTSLSVGKYSTAILVKNAGKVISYGLEQRDAAIKAGGVGATTLIYSDGKFIMPGFKAEEYIKDDEISRLLISNLQPSNGDVVIIGGGLDKYTAKIAAKMAAIETLKSMLKEDTSE